MGYRDLSIQIKDSDFIVILQFHYKEGVDPVEVAAALASENSTATIVWSYLLTDFEQQNITSG